ncbi:MAG: dipicolinate synthase subunit B [Bacillota bacterium]|nr:dipicolinate synthase subunit B [Bacillota bacterium]
MSKPRVGLALCGSYCTYDKLFNELPELAEKYDIIPIMSDTAAHTDSRFGKAEDFKGRLTALTGHPVAETVVDAEPLGPSAPMDALIIAPCTGNTLAKLAAGITDSAVTMAAKAHLRNGRPLIIAFSTNDGLSGSAKNIGELLNRKGYYFVPFRQDDFAKKPRSLASDFSLIGETLEAALCGKQLQPIIL